MSTPKHYGGCLCGDVNIAIDLESNRHIVCHCSDCQQASGSAFSCEVAFPAGSVKVTKGTPTVFDDLKPSGNHVLRYFCGRCGSALWSTLEVLGGVDVLKLGALNRPGGSGTKFFKPTVEVFVSSRQKWLKDIEGAAQWEQMP